MAQGMTTTSTTTPSVGDVLLSQIVGPKNSSGIPSTVFVENVSSFLTTLSLSSIEPLIGAQQQMYSKYKFMEANLLRSKQVLKKRIPETKGDLKMLHHLLTCEMPCTTRFSLADNVFAQGVIEAETRTVGIWLGVSYNIFGIFLIILKFEV